MARERISACLIVRDEADVLDGCLKSIRPYVDEIVVCDTGSSDDTIAIARANGALVVHFDWCDDFAAARNAALAEASGDWILSLDADEVLDVATASGLRRLIGTARRASTRNVVYGIAIHDVQVTEGIVRARRIHAMRFFRHTDALRWVYELHEQVFNVVTPSDYLYIPTDAVVLIHGGYMRERWVSKDKHARNERILRAALDRRPDDPMSHYNLARQLSYAGDAAQGVTHAERALELARTAKILHTDGGAYIMQMAVECAIGTANWRHGVAIAQETVSLHPDYADAWNNLGFCQLQCGRFDDAIRAFTRAIDRAARPSPYSTDLAIGEWLAWSNMSVAYLNKGEYVRALECLFTALRNQDDHPGLHNACTLPLVALGLRELAVENLEAIVARWPDFRPAQVLLKGLSEIADSETIKDTMATLVQTALARNPADPFNVTLDTAPPPDNQGVVLEFGR